MGEKLLNCWAMGNFKGYSIFDLLFIADETNDNMDIDEHLFKYQDYLKK